MATPGDNALATPSPVAGAPPAPQRSRGDAHPGNGGAMGRKKRGNSSPPRVPACPSAPPATHTEFPGRGGRNSRQAPAEGLRGGGGEGGEGGKEGPTAGPTSKQLLCSADERIHPHFIFSAAEAEGGGKGGAGLTPSLPGEAPPGHRRHFPGRGGTVAGGDSGKARPGGGPGSSGGPGAASASGGRNGNGNDFPLEVLG